jgi:CHAT domain-containing protein
MSRHHLFMSRINVQSKAFVLLFVACSIAGAAVANPDQWEREANSAYARQQYAQAMQLWRRALVHHQAAGARAHEARLAGTIGHALFMLDDYRQAKVYLEPFLHLTVSLNERRAQAVAASYLGLTDLYLGSYSQAELHLAAGERLMLEQNDLSGRAIAIGGLAETRRHLGKYQQALDAWRILLDIGTELKDEQMSATARLGMATVYMELGNTPATMAQLDQINRAAQSDPLLRARRSNVLGLVAQGRREYREALDHYDAGLDAINALSSQRQLQIRLDLLGNKAETLAQLDRHDLAVNIAHQSVALARRFGHAQSELNSLLALATAFELAGDGRSAIASSEEALRLAMKLDVAARVIEALVAVGTSHMRAGKYGMARVRLLEATERADALRNVALTDVDRISLFDAQLAAYRLLRDLFVHEKKFALALEFAERARAQAFNLLLSKRTRDSGSSGQHLTWTEIQAVIRAQNATAIEYSVDIAHKHLQAWVVKPDGGVEFVSTPLTQPLLSTVIEARGATARATKKQRGLSVRRSTAAQQDDQPLQSAYKLLIAPLEKLLPADDNSVLIIVPEQELFLLPWAALQAASGEYFIERFALSVLPSLTSLSLLQQRGGALTRALIVGNPTPLSAEISALPGAEAEARQVASLFDSHALIGDEATETRVRRELFNADLIHLATHGVLTDRGEGMPGALVLARTAQDDGWFTTMEIGELRTNAQLVVLSACDTGGGTLTGDGVVGLARAIFLAGSPSAVVSLWQVDDRATRDLMVSFYTSLIGNSVSKAHALRSAMLATRNKYPHPYFWSAFTLMGDTTVSRRVL